uniref:Uncharacterized protein n=1 Tax=Oryza rufipogon TaxID=4529 RepID=A0A0E0MWM7_ORYRU
MSSTHIFLLPLRVQHGGRGASTSGSRDRAGKPLPPPQPQSLFVRSALLYYPHTPSIFVADLPLPCGLPVAVALDMCLRPVNHSRRSGVVPPDVSAEAEGDDLSSASTLASTPSARVASRLLLPPPIAILFYSLSPSSSLLFFIAIAEGGSGVGDGKGRDGVPHLPRREEAAWGDEERRRRGRSVRRSTSGGSGSARKDDGGSGREDRRGGVAAAARRGRAAAAAVGQIARRSSGGGGGLARKGGGGARRSGGGGSVKRRRSE